MILIAHRINKIEDLKNINPKYGIEIDIRAKGNRLILNHEPHQDGDDFEEYLKSYKHRFIILDIKEAGIEEEVINLVKKYGIEDYFLLDVEYPFIYKATRKNITRKIAVRYSEAEPVEFTLAHKGLVDWVWVDVNTTLPLNPMIYQQLYGLKLALVSPDRWGRPQDIKKYREYLEKNNIKIDAVMVEKSLIPEWE